MLTALVFFGGIFAASLVLYPLCMLALYAMYRHDGGRLPLRRWIKRI